ncbi:MAG: transglycosylase SLT domain-containing protein [Acidobacteria bacterium]|nr:transglycosylase SLT domain-containing protein [Acidobacteriota bacterium]
MKRKAPDHSPLGRSALFLVALLLSAPHPGRGSGQSPAAVAPRIPASLDPLERDYSAPVAAALRSLERSAADFAQQRYGKALEGLTGIETVSGFLVADYAVNLRAQAWSKLGRPAEAARAYRMLRERWPQSRLHRESILGECAALLEDGRPKEAIALLDGSGLGIDSGTLYHRARIEEALGNRKTALSLYLRVSAEYVNASEAAPAEARLAALAPAYASRPEHLGFLLQRSDNLLRTGRSADARSLLLRLRSVRTTDKAALQRRAVLLADAERRQGRNSRALALLRGVTAADPEIHARALYLQAVCNRALRREAAFIEARDQAAGLYPESPWTERILYSVATYYEVENRRESIEQAYEALLRAFPKGAHARRASWRVALCAYEDGRYEEALGRFGRHLVSSPSPAGAAAAGYWMARCYERLNDPRSALLIYRRVAALANLNYYGQLAQQAAASARPEGGIAGTAAPEPDLQKALRIMEALQARPVLVAEPAGPAAAAIERARQLVMAGLPEEALEELRIAAERFPEEKSVPYVAARIHERRGDSPSAIGALYSVLPGYALSPVGCLPHEIREILFPLRYLDIVHVHSTARGLEPSLVLAIIRQESAFKEDARSTANARGLMQILPSTGRRLARQAALRGYSVRKLYEAATNIDLGTRYLSDLLRMFGGKIELALAAYNAGENRVQRWRTQFGDADMPLFVEQVPFTETRDYLRQVLTHRAHYRTLLKAENSAVE